MILEKSGVYEILNTISGRRYIGSAVCFRKRFYVHRCNLRARNHHSPKLQNAWNKHGEEKFIFTPLLVCAKKDLLLYEQRSIDLLKPFYNIAPNARSMLGFKHPPISRARMAAAASARKGRVCSAVTRAKIAATLRGQPMSAERRRKQSEAKLGKPWSVARRAAHLNHKEKP